MFISLSYLFLYVRTRYVHHRNELFTNYLLFSPSNICTLWENESPNVKINQITCLYVYQECEYMHACHVHEIQFCIAWFVYVFIVSLFQYSFCLALITEKVKHLDYECYIEQVLPSASSLA